MNEEALARSIETAEACPTAAAQNDKEAMKRLLRNCDLTFRVALCAPVAFPVGALAAV
jgi:hypothetical protein